MQSSDGYASLDGSHVKDVPATHVYEYYGETAVLTPRIQQLPKL